MGFSAMSLIEILYYVTLRLACNLKYRRNGTNKTPQNKDVDDILQEIKVFSPETR